jgi:hypothetical protein
MLLSRCRNSTVFGFYGMPYGRHWSAPGVQSALAGVVHDRQSADYEHSHGEDDQYVGFHCDLAAAGPKAYRSRFFVIENEPTVNALIRGARIPGSGIQPSGTANDNLAIGFLRCGIYERVRPWRRLLRGIQNPRRRRTQRISTKGFPVSGDPAVYRSGELRWPAWAGMGRDFFRFNAYSAPSRR